MSEELKPCPFCGGQPECHAEDDGAWVICKSCGTESAYCGSKRAAAATWNRRTEELAAAHSAMQSLSDARQAEALPEDALDALEQAASALIASMAVDRASNEKK